MSILFQLYSDLDSLKNNLRELAKIWQKGDNVLLLANTAAYIDWVFAYLTEIVPEQDIAASINWYVLKMDVEQLSPITKQNIDFETYQVKILTDDEWVALTQQVSKTITL